MPKINSFEVISALGDMDTEIKNEYRITTNNLINYMEEQLRALKREQEEQKNPNYFMVTTCHHVAETIAEIASAQATYLRALQERRIALVKVINTVDKM